MVVHNNSKTTMMEAVVDADALAVPAEDVWRNSSGRRMLYSELKSGKIPNNMPYKEVFRMHPEYAVGESYEEAERLFQSRLSSARWTIAKRDARAADELRMMLDDRLLHPAPAFDANGFRRWQGSAAQAKLLQDVREKKHETMTREAFFQSRPEYTRDYTQQYISRKIEQAVKTNKFLKQYRKKKGHTDNDRVEVDGMD